MIVDEVRVTATACVNENRGRCGETQGTKTIGGVSQVARNSNQAGRQGQAGWKAGQALRARSRMKRKELKGKVGARFQSRIQVSEMRRACAR